MPDEDKTFSGSLEFMTSRAHTLKVTTEHHIVLYMYICNSKSKIFGFSYESKHAQQCEITVEHSHWKRLTI